MPNYRFDDVWESFVEACGGVCVMCGGVREPLTNGQNIPRGTVERDHIILQSQGGEHTLKNTQPLCPWCNSGKGRDNTDYRPVGWQERFLAILGDKIRG